MKMKIVLLSGLLMCCLLAMQAQQTENDLRQIYMQAEKEYGIGRFDTTICVLDAHMPDFSGTLRTSACRLLALCYLGKDDVQQAEHYTALLLHEDPYYNVTIHDPLRFADLVDRLKRGSDETITTASQQAETLKEAPVPVTLVTEEMIKAIGARTLKDVLIAYVPGMTSVESPNEVNVAMHGVYSAGQEKILIMLNGQRMNARATNKSAPDYSISLDKVKQIEVLRGPASSLYGNVALTAVVNLITKDGRDVDGIELSAGLGNFETVRGDMVFGKRLMDVDFMGWASVYSSGGEKVFVPKSESIGINPHDGFMWVDAYNSLPSYDLGLVVDWKNLSFNFHCRYGKKVPPLGDIYTSMGASYDYEAYKRVSGESVGHGMSFTHAGTHYVKRLGRLTLDVDAYFDLNRSSLYSVTGDSVPSPMNGMDHFGYFQMINWSEYTIGGIVSAGYAYPGLGRWGKGHLLLGVQVEYMDLFGSDAFVGDDFDHVFMYWTANQIVITGHEASYSPFIQLKHTFNKHWILNLGGREDCKRRKSGKTYSSFSPRMSLIYLMNERFNMKAGYSRAFVDAPYFNRYANLPSFSGPEDLRPEYMDAIQVSFNYTPMDRLSWDGVFFYNKLTDFIYRNPNAGADDYRYLNAGRLQTFGIENTLQYTSSRFFANLNMTWQTVLDGEDYTYTGHRVHNVPNWFANLSVQGNIWRQNGHDVWLYGSGRLTGRQISPIENVIIGGEMVNDPDHFLPANFLLNAGVRYQFRRWGVELSFYNLLDKTYRQGGSTSVPYVQQGLSGLLSLTCKIK